LVCPGFKNNKLYILNNKKGGYNMFEKNEDDFSHAYFVWEKYMAEKLYWEKYAPSTAK
jgi:hypothetical protein